MMDLLDITYRDLIIKARLDCYRATGDEYFITKPYYETKDSEPDYSIPDELEKIVFNVDEEMFI